jgi:hypothetical protein
VTRRKGSHLAQTERTRAELFDPVTGLVPWVTDRQLGYWIERGLIIPDGPPAQGRPREFSETEKRVLRTLARLVRAGFPAQPAAQIARRAVTLAGENGTEAAVTLSGGDLAIVIENI